jgi:hypothetical protein
MLCTIVPRHAIFACNSCLKRQNALFKSSALAAQPLLRFRHEGDKLFWHLEPTFACEINIIMFKG